MKKYTFIGTEKDLVDNGFLYQKHYDNYICSLFTDNNVSKQDFYIQINAQTKEVLMWIRCLNGHYNRQAYFECIKLLLDKGIIGIKEETL